MTKVLTPGLEVIRGLANLLAELGKGVSEAVRVDVGQPGIGKGFQKYRANGRGRAPVFPR